MEINRLDINKWACIGNLWGDDYTLEMAREGIKYRTLICDWFNFLHIPELTDLEVRLPRCLSFGQVHYQCTGLVWCTGYSEWGEFWEWFLNEELNLMGQYDFTIKSEGGSDNILTSKDGFLYFHLDSYYRRHEYLKISPGVLFTRYWNEDTKARVISALPSGLFVKNDHKIYRDIEKLRKEKDPLKLAAALFNIQTKYWYLFRQTNI